MTARNIIPSLCEEATLWRRELHRNPGIKYEEHFAAALVAQKLAAWGIPHRTGLGKTGIVAFIEGRKNTSGKTIALRADMDALPIQEAGTQDWASKVPGRMHACGHDGHTANLLGAAKYLNETRNFDGRVMLVFQPAEEGGRGAFAMMEDGLFKGDMACDAVYGLHNWPSLPYGRAGIRKGPLMASVDNFRISIKGHGGHAAYPARCIDPVVVGASIVTALQGIVARMVPAQEMAVISTTNFKAGTGAFNVIADDAELSGTVRTFSNKVRDSIEEKLKTMAASVAAAYGAGVDIWYEREIDPTINHPRETDIAAAAMARVIGAGNVDADIEPSLGGEDFGGMLAAVPGAYIFVGQGVPENPSSPHNRGLHNPSYDFNDAILPIGIGYFAELVESEMPLGQK